MDENNDVLTSLVVLEEADEATQALFDPCSGTIVACTREAADAVRKAQRTSGSERDPLCCGSETLLQVVTWMQRARARIREADSDGSPGLGKLTLLLSTACNLNCTYCYAGGGNYGLPAQNMPPDVVQAAFEAVYTHYGALRTVQLFGGEPLLNPAGIAEACAQATRWSAKLSVATPRIGIVTNLFHMPESFPTLVRDYGLSVTASLDGPPCVNDANRVDRRGQGTFATVADNIRRLKELTGEPSGIEATYTHEHAAQGITPECVYDYFRETFGVKRILVVPAQKKPSYSANEATLAEATAEEPGWQTETSAYERLRSFCDGRAGIQEMDLNWISQLSSPPRPEVASLFCTAGFQLLAVTPSGDLFPCHLFAGHSSFRMGNVCEGLHILIESGHRF